MPPTTVRLVVDLLKAQQLGLFGRPPMQMAHTKPANAALHVEKHEVHAHTRHTAHGTVAVAPHLRTVLVATQHAPVPHHAAPVEPDPEPEVTPEPEPIPAPPDVPIATAPVESPIPAPAAPPAPPPEPTPAPEAAPERSGEPVHQHRVTDARAEWFYTRPAAGTNDERRLDWMPPDAVSLGVTPIEEPGTTQSQWDKHGRETITRGPSTTRPGEVWTMKRPLNFADARLLGLVPVEPTNNSDVFTPRRFDGRETGQTEQAGEDGFLETVGVADEAPRELFPVLLARKSSFLSAAHKLQEKAKKLGLEPPVLTELGTVMKRSPVELVGWGNDATVKYEMLPATIYHIAAPEFRVKGWTIEAIIKPVEGTTKTRITRTGKATDLPLRLWSTGMHCDQCGTTRDRSFVAALRNDKSGAWQQVGGSCLADFTGQSASRLASCASELANWWKQGGDDDLGSFDKVGRGPEMHDLDDILMATAHVMEETGGYWSRAKAEENHVKATADMVRELLQLHQQAAAVKANVGYQQRAAAVKAWMQGLPLGGGGDDYLGNLHAVSHGTGVDRRSLGIAASGMAAYDRAQAAAVKPSANAAHFGKPGDKIGRKVPKKDKAAGVGEHPTHRVKVVAVHSFNTDYGLKSNVVMKDNDGHTFKWGASGGASWAGGPDTPTGFNRNVVPGETFDMVGTIKGHGAFKGTQQTDVTRAELHRVYTPTEREFFDTAKAAARAKLEERRVGRKELYEKFEAEWPVIQEELKANGRFPGSMQSWEEFKKRTDPTLFARADYTDRGYPIDEHAVREANLTPEAMEHQADTEAHDKVRARAALKISAPIEHEVPVDMNKAVTLKPKVAGNPKPKPPPPPIPGAAGQPGGQPIGAVPPTPGQKVTFKHPATGEPTEGHIHAQGAAGATVVDGHGAVHKVPHGSYMHADPAEDDSQKPSAKLVAAAAKKHLELGPDKPLAVHAAAALLAVGGVDTAHELEAKDLEFADGYCRVIPDKLQTNEPALVQMLQQLAKRNPKGPVFAVGGEPITEAGLTTYVRRFGIGPVAGAPGGAPPPSPPPGAAVGSPPPQPMAKASASAMELPREGEELARWVIDGYLVTFRKGGPGLGVATISHDSLPLPLHEVCQNPASAKRFAADAIRDLRAGRTPERGVYQAVTR